MLFSLLPVAAHAFTLTLADTSELRVRSDVGGPFVDLATTPRATLSLNLRHTAWSIYYAPTFLETAVGSPYQGRILINSGGLTLRLRLSPTTTFNAMEEGSYGTQNFRILGVSTPAAGTTTGGGGPGDSSTVGNNAAVGVTPNVVAALGSNTITFGSLVSTVGATHRFSHGWSANESIGYSIWGQLGGQQPVLMPISRTYSANAALGYSLHANDQVVISEGVRFVTTEPIAKAFIASSTAGWNHGFSATTASSLSVGASYVQSTNLRSDRSRRILPNAAAALTFSTPVRPPGSRFTGTVSLGVTPFVDARLGGVTKMFTGNAGAQWSRRRISLQLTGYVSRALESSGGVSVVSVYGLSEMVGYRVDRRGQLALSVGSRQIFQQFSAGQQQLPVVWMAFAGLTYSGRAMPL